MGGYSNLMQLGNLARMRGGPIYGPGGSMPYGGGIQPVGPAGGPSGSMGGGVGPVGPAGGPGGSLPPGVGPVGPEPTGGGYPPIHPVGPAPFMGGGAFGFGRPSFGGYGGYGGPQPWDMNGDSSGLSNLMLLHQLGGYGGY